MDLSLHTSAGTKDNDNSISSARADRDPPAADTSRALDAELAVFLDEVSGPFFFLSKKKRSVFLGLL